MKQPETTQTSHLSGRRPEYVIVVAQLAGRNWGNGPSLIEALEVGDTPMAPRAEADSAEHSE